MRQPFLFLLEKFDALNISIHVGIKRKRSQKQWEQIRDLIVDRGHTLDTAADLLIAVMSAAELVGTAACDNYMQFGRFEHVFAFGG